LTLDLNSEKNVSGRERCGCPGFLEPAIRHRRPSGYVMSTYDLPEELQVSSDGPLRTVALDRLGELDASRVGGR